MKTPTGIFVGLIAMACSAPVLAQCGTWTPPVNLSNDTGRYAVDASLALDAAGKVHVIYQSFLDTSGNNYYTTNASGSWSTPAALGSMGGKGSAPRIVITPDAQLHVFFGKNTLYWRTKPVSDGGWSTAQQVSVAPASGFIEGITVDSSGGIYFLYGNLFDDSAPARNGIYGRYKPLGGTWQATELIYGNSQDGNWPLGSQIIARGTTLWVTIEVDDKMYFKKKMSAGVWPSGKGTQFIEEGGGLHFAFDAGSNEIAALWGRSFDCPSPCEQHPWHEAFVKYSYDDGASWSGTYNLSNMVNDIDRTPTGTYDANGNLHVIWEGFCCDHKLRMRYRARVGGAWGDIQTLSSLAGGYISEAIQARGLDIYTTFSNTGTGVGLYDVMFMMQAGTQTRITVDKNSIERASRVGDTVSSETLSVTNGCVGTLNYTIGTNVNWIQAAPASGSSTTDRDTIGISFSGAQQLLAGAHSGTIAVAGNAVNAPVNIPVSLYVQTVKPDLDGDGDVDQMDFGLLQACLSGSFTAQTDPSCQVALLDNDTDVDGDDITALIDCLSGPGVPVVRTCAGVR